jgi:imidazolonepropionase-like amidohydrolase
MLIRAGLPTSAALMAATTVGAEVLGLAESHGRIDPGRIADFILVDGNPFTDPTALRRVEWVVRDGRVVKEP